MEVVWSKPALNDLEIIHDFIAEDSIVYAQKVIEKLHSRVGMLQTQHRIGRMVPEYNDPNIRELIEGSYRIVHYIEVDKVVIARVRHTSQDMSAG